MFKVINLDNLATGQNVFKSFSTEVEANAYLSALANDFAKKGYEVRNIPASEGILFNDPQMLKVTKSVNVANPNAPENIIVFALIPCADNEFVTITRNRMKYYSEAEDETNYNFVNKSAPFENIHAEMVQNDYTLLRQENGISFYKSETDTFISEVYIF